jgi:hypothetical protein
VYYRFLNSVSSYRRTVLVEWRQAFKDKIFGLKLFLAPGLFFLYSSVTQKLGNYVEMRKGIRLDDQVLNLLPRIDFSAPIFFLLYISLSMMIVTHLHKPRVILRVIEMHFWVAIIRQICILLIALEPPAGIIVLRDLFLENTVYPRHSPLTKDLFFSGHVASIWLYYLCSEHRYLRYYLLIATGLMTFMILSMRVHYSYDVYGAIFITTLIYLAPDRIKNFWVSRDIVKQAGK